MAAEGQKAAEEEYHGHDEPWSEQRRNSDGNCGRSG